MTPSRCWQPGEFPTILEIRIARSLLLLVAVCSSRLWVVDRQRDRVLVKNGTRALTLFLADTVLGCQARGNQRTVALPDGIGEPRGMSQAKGRSAATAAALWPGTGRELRLIIAAVDRHCSRQDEAGSGRSAAAGHIRPEKVAGRGWWIMTCQLQHQPTPSALRLSTSEGESRGAYAVGSQPGLLRVVTSSPIGTACAIVTVRVRRLQRVDGTNFDLVASTVQCSHHGGQQRESIFVTPLSLVTFACVPVLYRNKQPLLGGSEGTATPPRIIFQNGGCRTFSICYVSGIDNILKFSGECG